jgi:hypothetical protein
MSELIPSKTQDEIDPSDDTAVETEREREIKGDKPPHHD